MTTGIGGLVLAGGQGRRMGGAPKVLRELHGETLLARALQRITPQVEWTLVSTADPAIRAVCAPHPVVADAVPDFAGPLAGILAGLEYAQGLPGCRWLLSVAADTPWFPMDLTARLRQAADGAAAEVAVACSGGAVHPVFALWSPLLVARLRRVLVEGGERSVQRFQAQCRQVQVDWPVLPRDPFFNINTPADLEIARRLDGSCAG